MSIGKYITGIFGSGVIAVILEKIWEMAEKHVVSGVTNQMGQKIVDKIIKPKGREDEYFFGLDILEANLTSGQKKIVQDGILLAEEYDLRSGTSSAQDFRIIVTVNDKNVPNGTARPGIKILEEVGKNCATKEEVFLFIQATGAMHGSAATLDKFIHFVETEALPFLQSKGKEITKSIADSIKGAANSVEIKLQERTDEHRNRSLWKKYLVN